MGVHELSCQCLFPNLCSLHSMTLVAGRHSLVLLATRLEAVVVAQPYRRGGSATNQSIYQWLRIQQEFVMNVGQHQRDAIVGAAAASGYSVGGPGGALCGTASRLLCTVHAGRGSLHVLPPRFRPTGCRSCGRPSLAFLPCQPRVMLSCPALLAHGAPFGVTWHGLHTMLQCSM